jgi:Flp pilus assembly protein TadD
MRFMAEPFLAKSITVRGGLLIAILVVFAYLPCLDAGFVWDDDAHVTHNEALRSSEGLHDIWFKVGSVQQYYPMVYTTFWVQYHLWGNNAAGYHLVNILLHAANAFLLLLLLRNLGVRGAWVIAAVFALHPVQAESVAWISELKNCLSTFFYFSAALSYIRFDRLWERSAHTSAVHNDPNQETGLLRRARLNYLLAIGFYLLALFSKTVTASLPAALLLLAYWKRERIRWRDVIPLLPFFALGISAGLFTIWVEKHLIGAQGYEWSHSFVDRLLIAGRGVWFYAGKLVWPVTLTFNYPKWRIDSSSWQQYLYLVGLVGALTTLWLTRRRIGKGPLVATLFFIGTLFPALGFFDIYPMRYSYVADHYQYVASIGLIAMLVGTGAHLSDRYLLSAHAIRAISTGSVVLTLAFLTWLQVHIYENKEILYRDTISKNENSFLAHYNLAKLLEESGRVDQAERHYAKTIAIEPTLAEAHNNLGLLLLKQGRLDGAIQMFSRAAELKPHDPLPRRNLADSLLEDGARKEAMAIYESLLRANPNDPVLHKKLALALATSNQYEPAIAHLQEALRIAPTYADAHFALAEILLRLKRTREAVSHYRTALQLKRQWPEAALRLSWILSTDRDPALRNGPEAVRIAEEIRKQVARPEAQVLDTLAAAYAEAGRFEAAVRFARLAADKARSEGDHALADAVERRLVLYKAGQPFREDDGSGPSRT